MTPCQKPQCQENTKGNIITTFTPFYSMMSSLNRLKEPYHGSPQQELVPSSVIQKSRIRETKHPSTDADSSTDTILGWTKNTPKPDFFEKWKKSSTMQKLKNA